MKLFQKSALAVAIAAVPFLSVNAMEALDDAALSEMTGQAGVTIETTVSEQGISVGSVEYIDEGSAFIQGIRSKSADAAGYTTTQVIDIDASGNLVTSTTTTGTGNLLEVDFVQLRSKDQAAEVSGQPVNASVAGSGANLVTDLKMTTKQDGTSYATVLNLSDVGYTAGTGDGSQGTGTAAVIGTNNTLLSLDATNDRLVNASIGTGSADITGALDRGSDLAIVTQGSSQITDLDVKLLDGAIEIENMTMYDTDSSGNKIDIVSTQVIWAKGGDVASGGGVYIQGSDSKATINIETVRIAQNSIGSLKIRDMNQSGSVTRIYGH